MREPLTVDELERLRVMKISDREGAMLEHVEFRRKVAEHDLANILSPDALMLSFLALGSKMWRDKCPT